MGLRLQWLLGSAMALGLGCPYTSAQPAPAALLSPAVLVQQMVYNDLQDRDQGSYWTYHIEKTADGLRKSEDQVETKEGPVYRLLAINGKPLDAGQQRAEQERVHRLMTDPAEQQKVKQQHDDDEAHVRKLMELLPRAFLYDFDGNEGANLRLRFHPNPSFEPSSYEERMFQGLSGTVVMDAQKKRLVEMKGQLFADVEFGFGLLGRLNKGSNFAIAREPVNAMHWKTDRVNVHVTGHLILFKTVSKQQDEVRSDFRQVASDLTVAQALDLLDRK